MFHCLDNNSFFGKIVPVDGSPAEKQVSIFSCFSEIDTKALRVLKSFGFLGFVNLFDLTGVRNSLAGIVVIFENNQYLLFCSKMFVY